MFPIRFSAINHIVHPLFRPTQPNPSENIEKRTKWKTRSELIKSFLFSLLAVDSNTLVSEGTGCFLCATPDVSSVGKPPTTQFFHPQRKRFQFVLNVRRIMESRGWLLSYGFINYHNPTEYWFTASPPDVHVWQKRHRHLQSSRTVV